MELEQKSPGESSGPGADENGTPEAPAGGAEREQHPLEEQQTSRETEPSQGTTSEGQDMPAPSETEHQPAAEEQPEQPAEAQTPVAEPVAATSEGHEEPEQPRPTEPQAPETQPTEPQQPAEPERTPAFWLSIWHGQKTPPADLPEHETVHAGNLVVEGLLVGSENYILAAGQAAAGAVSRIKARAFRVAALKQILVTRLSDRLGLTPLLTAGDRFLLAGPAGSGWQEVLHSLQRELDIWLFQHFQPTGLLRVELSGAMCEADRLPVDALAQQKQHHALQPLEGALRVGVRWNGRAFVQPAGPHVFRCDGCGAVTQVKTFGEQQLCDECARDTELGERLPSRERAWICPENEADVPGPGLGICFSEPPAHGYPEIDLGIGEWALLRMKSAPLVELVAATSASRKLLGCLRIEFGQVHRAFASAGGDAVRTLALARALDGFLLNELRASFSAHYSMVLCASMSAHGALLAGPWQEVLDLGVRLNRDFGRIAAGAVTVSAGFAAAPVSVGLLAIARQAADQVASAHAAGGNRIAAFGQVIPWQRVAALVHQGKKVSAWVRQRSINLAWLERLSLLGQGAMEKDRARAAAQVAVAEARIRSTAPRAWALRLSSKDEQSDWPWIGFLSQYAALACGGRQPAEQKQTAAAPEGQAEPEESVQPAEEMQPAEE